MILYEVWFQWWWWVFQKNIFSQNGWCQEIKMSPSCQSLYVALGQWSNVKFIYNINLKSPPICPSIPCCLCLPLYSLPPHLSIYPNTSSPYISLSILTHPLPTSLCILSSLTSLSLFDIASPNLSLFPQISCPLSPYISLAYIFPSLYLSPSTFPQSLSILPPSLSVSTLSLHLSHTFSVSQTVSFLPLCYWTLYCW